MSNDNTVEAGTPAPAHDRRPQEVREALTMALYVGLSLQAVLLVTPTLDAGADPVGAAVQIFLTAIGLLVAHQVALRLSTKFTNGGLLDEETLRSIRAQSIGGLPVAFLASLPVLIWGSVGLFVAEGLLLAFVATVGYLAARSKGAGRPRSVAYVLVVVVVVAVVLSLKIVVKH